MKLTANERRIIRQALQVHVGQWALAYHGGKGDKKGEAYDAERHDEILGLLRKFN